jgi:hypothetical protein
MQQARNENMPTNPSKTPEHNCDDSSEQKAVATIANEVTGKNLSA